MQLMSSSGRTQCDSHGLALQCIYQWEERSILRMRLVPPLQLVSLELGLMQLLTDLAQCGQFEDV
jgi:hypothetical protein